MSNLVWSFAPWLIFWLAARVSSYEEAVWWALAAAAIVVARSVARKHLHLLDLAGGAYFIGLAIIVVVSSSSDLGWLPKYAQAGSHVALTLIVFGSILLGHPFTESYARESTPPEYWDAPEFHHANRVISAVWGLAFLVGSVSLIIAGQVDQLQILLRLVIPIGALYWAFEFTQKRSSQAKASGPGTTDPGSAGAQRKDGGESQH